VLVLRSIGLPLQEVKFYFETRRQPSSRIDDNACRAPNLYHLVLDTYTMVPIIPSHMTTYQAIKHYGTQVELASALGITQASVSEWGDYPPKLRQLQLQQITRGRLKAEPGLLAVKQS
jgi:hypothetical protein